MKKALLILLTILAAFAVLVSCDNSVDYPFDDDVPASDTPEKVPLTFEVLKDGVITFTNIPNGMKFSRNSGALQAVESTIRVESGDRIRLFANRTSVEADKYLNINCSSDCYVYGNVMSLLKEDGFAEKNDVIANAFRGLFKDNSHILFHDSKKLVLPAKELADYCYCEMFYGCTGITKAPDLPAITLATGCYNSMFNGCSALNKITCLATDISAPDCTTNWVKGIASYGEFIKADGMEDWTVGPNGIPELWYSYPKYIPLTLEFIDGGTITILNLPTDPANKVYYTKNEGDLQAATSSIEVEAGDRVRFYADRISADYSKCIKIYCNSSCYIYGNVMSLISKDDYADLTEIPFENAFKELFSGNSYIRNHDSKKLVLPATTLKDRCYYLMFSNCSGLTEAPKLPAERMYYECYHSMFNGCKGLTKAPELPATTLSEWCYYSMFENCTNLTTAPDLNASNLVQGCYTRMFAFCSKLNSVTCLGVNVPLPLSINSCVSNWLEYAGASGTLHCKNDYAGIWVGNVPSDWTIIDDK